MIVGDPSTFAIESEISVAYERLSQRALGYFVLHVGGQCYGVRNWDATMLACSFDAVGIRIKNRGTHAAGDIENVDAEALATAYRRAVYMENEEEALFLGMQGDEFRDLIYSSKLVWAPDGDEAFDDGSYVLQLDIGDNVRLVAFNSAPDGYLLSGSLRDIRLSQEMFYSTLQSWHESFASEWASLAKADGTIPLIQ